MLPKTLLFSLIVLLLNISLALFLELPSASAQCATNPNNQGLISGLSITGSFGNVDTTCVLDPKAAYRDYKIPTYDELENQFYSLSRSTAKKDSPLTGNGFNIDGDGIYKQNSDMTVNSFLGTGVKVIFIRGNLTITGNIDYADTDPYSGLVFVASGNINIDSSVTKVNAVLISSSIICTAYASGICLDGRTPTRELAVNGSLISINKNSSLTQSIYLRRSLADNSSQASEVINKLAKYLYILKGGILTKDLIITTEDTNYPITPDPDAPVPEPPLPVCPAPNPLIISENVQAVPPSTPPCILAI